MKNINKFLSLQSCIAFYCLKQIIISAHFFLPLLGFVAIAEHSDIAVNVTKTWIWHTFRPNLYCDDILLVRKNREGEKEREREREIDKRIGAQFQAFHIHIVFRVLFVFCLFLLKLKFSFLCIFLFYSLELWIYSNDCVLRSLHFIISLLLLLW